MSTTFEITVHEDEAASRRERFRVLRAHPEIDGRWVAVGIFPSLKQAEAFARGMRLGYAFGNDRKRHG
jgi:2-oxo-4-hydroxy-4-carboxy--5-ureidoimidazoline (OHCU) decarboxylase